MERALPVGWNLLRACLLVAGAILCAATLSNSYAIIAWNEALLFGASAALLRLRPVAIRRDPNGKTLLGHVPGESLLLIALLRHGPETALAASLITNLIAFARVWRAWCRRGHFLAGCNIVYLPALAWCAGRLYQILGGQPVRVAADCAAVFHQPGAVLLPWIGATLLAQEIVNRSVQAASLRLGYGIPLRQTALDLSLGLFEHLECLGALLGLVLWTAWGWETLPATALVFEAILLSAREHARGRDARRETLVDPLTGLASGRGLGEAVRSRQRARTPFALLFLDMDRFKQVNDSLGHAAGDELLRLIATTLRAAVRETDIVARRSGDEFLILLDRHDRVQAAEAVRRLRATLHGAVRNHPQFAAFGIGVSAGVAFYPQDGIDEKTLAETADLRMYADKRHRQAMPLAA